jgi:hypothetical protein
MAPTYNEQHRAFFEQAWDILVEHAGARRDPIEKESFVRAFMQVEHTAIEWRFGGHLGFGGKFWRNDGRFYISCYPEDRTPKLDAIIIKVNTLLTDLVAKMTNASGS